MRIATTLFASCALLLSLSTSALEPNCPKDKCTVVITIPAGCGSGINVAPDPIVVAPKQKVEITWRIATPEWEFDGDGIVIHQAEASEFPQVLVKLPDPKVKNGVGRSHINKKTATFKYDINLIEKKNKDAKCNLDPTIVDQ